MGSVTGLVTQIIRFVIGHNRHRSSGIAIRQRVERNENRVANENTIADEYAVANQHAITNKYAIANEDTASEQIRD